jgi:hypothetical protein
MSHPSAPAVQVIGCVLGLGMIAACGQARGPIKQLADNPAVGTTAGCTRNSQCSGGLVCLSGSCTSCTNEDQCDFGLVCEDGRCIEPEEPDSDSTNASSCPTGQTCTAIQGGSVCLDNGGIPADAVICDAETGAGCPTGTVAVGTQDAQGNPGCACLLDCTTGGSTGDTGDTGGTGGTGGSTGETVECAPCVDDSDCGDGITAGCWLPDESGAAAYCALDCTDSDTCPTGSTCIPDEGDPYSTCIPEPYCDGSSSGTGGTGGTGGTTGETIECAPCVDDSDCGDGITAGCWLPDDSGYAAYCAIDCTESDTCPAGSTCIPDEGDPYSTCIPEPYCDGSSSGTSGGTCPSGTTCEAITGGSVCLENGDIPAGSGSCDATTGEGCASDEVPVSVSYEDGTEECVCLSEC